MREIVLDTETTGLDPEAGHRIVEIGCVELFNHLPTGRSFQRYINPERDMPEEAFRVHGLSSDFLANHPVFAAIVDEFLEFVGEAALVIHNAEFDLKFLNYELKQLGKPLFLRERATDTVTVARRKYPGAQVSLDALCRRFAIDNSGRTLHGALLDCQLLAEVYLELIGGREPELVIETKIEAGPADLPGVVLPGPTRPLRPPRPFAPTAEETAAHAEMLKKLKDPLWLA